MRRLLVVATASYINVINQYCSYKRVGFLLLWVRRQHRISRILYVLTWLLERVRGMRVQ